MIFFLRHYLINYKIKYFKYIFSFIKNHYLMSLSVKNYLIFLMFHLMIFILDFH